MFGVIDVATVKADRSRNNTDGMGMTVMRHGQRDQWRRQSRVVDLVVVAGKGDGFNSSGGRDAEATEKNAIRWQDQGGNKIGL